MSEAYYYPGMVESTVDFIFPNKEDLLKYDYTPSQIMVAFYATVIFFAWCVYRTHRFVNLPNRDGDPRYIIFWLILFGIIRYMLPPESAVIFSLMIGTFVGLIFAGIQLLFASVFVAMMCGKEGDCCGKMLFGGGLAVFLIILICFLMDMQILTIFSKKNYFA